MQDIGVLLLHVRGGSEGVGRGGGCGLPVRSDFIRPLQVMVTFLKAEGKQKITTERIILIRKRIMIGEHFHLVVGEPQLFNAGSTVSLGPYDSKRPKESHNLLLAIGHKIDFT